MTGGYSIGGRVAVGVVALVLAGAVGVPAQGGQSLSPDASRGQSPSPDVTFTKHIAPILQRSCENCHRADGVAPMSLSTYEEVRPWARAIKQRTGIGPRAGVMPPWYVEREIGIQKFKNDPSLSDEEIALVARWVDSGAPRGNPADMPPARVWNDSTRWAIGEPDLVVRTDEITVKAGAPDWWGEIAPTPTGLTEDRYVSAVEIREVNDVGSAGSGRAHRRRPLRVPPHDLEHPPARPARHRHRQRCVRPGGADRHDPGQTTWPVHEVGREPDFFDPKSARLLKAGSYVISDSVHLHSNGRDTKAHLEIGFKFMPKGYKPEYKASRVAPGQRRGHRHQGHGAATRSCTPTPCSPSTPRSSRSSRTSTRRAPACASRPSGATPSRR